MKRLLYIHGFLSSPSSFKAQQVKQWLQDYHPDIDFICPHLTPYPDDTASRLRSIIENHQTDHLGVMGSSLGGFWAHWVAETFGLNAVLINPAVAPQQFMPEYLNRPLKGYYSDDVYQLNAEHIRQIIRYDSPVHHPERIWLLAQTGDETLDYRQAVTKFHQCKQTVEVGGDHAFTGFERYLAPSLEFLFHGNTSTHK